MSTHGKKGAIYASFIANIGVGVSKFIAFFITGSSSMLAEGVHSVVDSSNQVLLLIGGRQSRQKPTKTHPFGYGRAHFLYAFIISIVLFALGGLFSLYEGIEKITHPHMIASPVVAYVVLAIAVLLEGLALRTAMREAQSFKPRDQNWLEFLRQTKSVNHVVLTLEDSAALIGLTFATIGISMTLLTGDPTWDGIATLAIALLLGVVAYFLFHEVKSLLIGEAVDEKTERKMRQIILSVEEVDKVVDLKTLYIGPNDLLIVMKITVGAEDSAGIVARTIDEVEARLRQAYPIAHLVYVEPDLYKTRQEQRRSDDEVEKLIADI